MNLKKSNTVLLIPALHSDGRSRHGGNLYHYLSQDQDLYADNSEFDNCGEVSQFFRSHFLITADTYSLDGVETLKDNESPIDISKLLFYLKENVKLFYLSKTNNPEAFSSIRNFIKASTNRYYYRRWISDEILDQLENVIIVKDTTNYHLDLENNFFSFFPKELFSHFSQNYQQTIDLTSFFTDNSPELNKFPIFKNSVYFSAGRGSVQTKFVSNNENPSDLFFIKKEKVSHFNDLYSDKRIPIVKFKSMLKGSSDPERTIKLYNSSNFHTGYGFFPYAVRNCLNLIVSPTETKSINFYGFATFMDSKKVTKYVKAKTFLNAFLQAISIAKGSYLYDTESYERIKKEIYGMHTTYIDNITNMFPNSTPTNKKSLILNSQAKAVKNLNVDTISSMNHLNSFVQMKEYKDYKSITDTIKELERKREKCTEFIQTSESRKNRKTREISDLERQNENYQQYIVSNNATIAAGKAALQKWDEELTQNINKKNETETIITSLLPQKENIYSNYKSILTTKISETASSDSNKFIKNLNSQGIYIKEITYSTSDGEKSVSQDPTLTTKAKEGALLDLEDYPKLHKICFEITKPVIIRVDPVEKGENCPKIVSGPYYVELYSNTLRLSPLASNFVFGHNPNNHQFWIHPHTSSRSYNYSTVDEFLRALTTTSLNGCLGEASSALYNAFQAQDPRQCILAAMSWITSANSTDAWGKHWKYFPRLEDVKGMSNETSIQQCQQDEIERRLTDADSIISNIFENELDTTYYDDLDEAFVTEQQQQVVESIAEEVLEEPEVSPNSQNLQTNLRTPGVEGYVPLSTLNR